MPVRLRAVSLPQRARADRARHRPVFLSAEAASAPRRRALWNDVFVRRGGRARHPARHDQGDGADRDAARPRSRWTRSCYALREHAAGLNCGRWDYIFSFIKTRRDDPAAVLPDRAQVTMTQPCMRAYTQLLIRTCHRRGAFAMGGMAAQIPVKNDPAANATPRSRRCAPTRRAR